MSILVNIDLDNPMEHRSRDRLGTLAESELRAHARRCDILGIDVLGNIPWTILIGLMNAELQSIELSVEEVAYFERVPEELVLRWSKILSNKGLIFIHEYSSGECKLSLRAKGRTKITHYLNALEIFSD